MIWQELSDITLIKVVALVQSLMNYLQNLPNTSRYHHITNEQFKEILQENVPSAKTQLCTKYGLRLKPSILDKLKRDRHLQNPQDIYYATAGKIGRLLEL